MKKRTIIISIVVIVAVLILIPFFKKKEKTEYKLNTVVAAKGVVTNSVTATGTVEPIDQVEVGTQVSGIVDKIFVDFNSVVKRGQVLAELDKSTLKARLLQSKASLASAQNELTYQTQNFNRIKTLFETEMVSETEYESAMYKLNNATTSVDRLISEVEQAEVNLSYATIISPIDGVVLDRAVEEGQTVAASFNTPTLFTIARDLTRMQVEADVDEADIGEIVEGQKVVFEVDAFPQDQFVGSISQIRLKPTVTSSVVTYTVIVDAPNPDLKLKPGLTANITIITKEQGDVITVPVSALNFQPGTDLLASYTIAKPPHNGEKPKGDAMPPAGFMKPNAGEGMPKMVWVKNGRELAPRMVETGMSDRATIAITKGVSEGDTIVTSSQVMSAMGANQRPTSPFMPSRPGGRR